MNLSRPEGFHAYRPAAWLRVTGEDAATFLQGQFTNDLGPIRGSGSAYGLWLDVKGKVVADSFILGGPDAGEFRVLSYFSQGSAIRKRLEDFIVADDVSVEDAGPGWEGIALLGPEAGAWLGAGPRPGAWFPGRRGGDSWEWILPPGEMSAARAQLAGVPELGPGEMELRRIGEAIPAVPADIGPGDLPNEGGLDRDAISYTKGCYLGQEVMARLKSKGRLRRRLRPVEGEGPPPATPAALWAGPVRAGELRSAAALRAGFAGLAMIALSAPEGALALAPGGPASVLPARPRA